MPLKISRFLSIRSPVATWVHGTQLPQGDYRLVLTLLGPLPLNENISWLAPVGIRIWKPQVMPFNREKGMKENVSAIAWKRIWEEVNWKKQWKKEKGGESLSSLKTRKRAGERGSGQTVPAQLGRCLRGLLDGRERQCADVQCTSTYVRSPS